MVKYIRQTCELVQRQNLKQSDVEGKEKIAEDKISSIAEWMDKNKCSKVSRT